MKALIVRTKEQLKEAQEEKVEEIIISGGFADKLKKAKQITKLGATGLAILTAALAATPFTSGLSMFAAPTVAALTGLEIVAIITASSLGIALIMAVFKGYEEISFEKGKMTLRKKQA